MVNHGFACMAMLAQFPPTIGKGTSREISLNGYMCCDPSKRAALLLLLPALRAAGAFGEWNPLPINIYIYICIGCFLFRNNFGDELRRMPSGRLETLWQDQDGVVHFRGFDQLAVGNFMIYDIFLRKLSVKSHKINEEHVNST